MKKSICVILLILLITLCGCKEKMGYQDTEVVLDASPERTQTTLFVCGTDMDGVYTSGGTEYIKVRPLAKALSGNLDVYRDRTDHQARLTVGDKGYTFTTLDIGTETYKDCLYDGSDWYAPKDGILADIIEEYSLDELTDTENGIVYYTDYPKSDTLPEGVRVPAFMYHAVSNNCWGIEELFVSPENMEQQLKFLTENGYTPIFFEDLDKADKIEKPVLLTFDDGYVDNYTELFPLLKKYNVKATVFLITGNIGTDKYLNEAQIKEMAQSGLVSFQSHTVTHPFLSECTESELDYELMQSKLDIVRLTGKEPFVLCYPTGKYSQTSLDKTREYYQFGILMTGQTYETGDNPVKIYRKYVKRETGIESFKSMLD